MRKEEKGRYLESKSVDLLQQFEQILESDPLIDEVAFIHPSQFAKLNEDAGDGIAFPSSDSASFWTRDHKLGISTQVLLPLYNAAKQSFMAAIGEYKRLGEDVVSDDRVENDVMMHSRALVLLSSDFGTAWNSRKLVVSKKHHLSKFMEELLLSELVLSCSPKSDRAWSHRRWVIKSVTGKCSTLQDIVMKESELVQKIAERSKMNYRAWNHRCWLVSNMTREQVLNELKKSRKWAELHVADNCCFHYRRRLMVRILKDVSCKQENASSGYTVETNDVWKEELDWNEMLIKHYIGREALWLHRRFLSLCWIKQFASDLGNNSCHSEQEVSISNGLGFFLDNELRLLESCSTVVNNDFDDFEAQAKLAATYILWLAKQIPEFQIELQEKLTAENLKSTLTKMCQKGPALGIL